MDAKGFNHPSQKPVLRPPVLTLPADDEDYTVLLLSDDRTSKGGEDEATLVQEAVQHIRQTNYSSYIQTKVQSKIKRKFPNPKPTRAQLLAEPITHTLYFKATETFDRPKVIQDSRAKNSTQV